MAVSPRKVTQAQFWEFPSFLAGLGGLHEQAVSPALGAPHGSWPRGTPTPPVDKSIPPPQTVTTAGMKGLGGNQRKGEKARL